MIVRLELSTRHVSSSSIAHTNVTGIGRTPYRIDNRPKRGRSTALQPIVRAADVDTLFLRNGQEETACDKELQLLFTLLPDVHSANKHANMTTWKALAEQVPAVAAKLVTLRDLLPAANVSRLVARLPSLLVDEHFAAISPSLQQLSKGLQLGSDELSNLVSSYPELLLSTQYSSDVLWRLQRQLNLSPTLFGCLASKLQLHVTPLDPTTAEACIDWLASESMNAAQMVLSHPQVLRRHVEGDLRPCMHWMLQQGLSRDQARLAVQQCPELLSMSIQHQLRPRVRWLMSHNLSQRQVADLLGRNPGSFLNAAMDRIGCRLSFLRHAGIQVPEDVEQWLLPGDHGFMRLVGRQQPTEAGRYNSYRARWLRAVRLVSVLNRH